MAAIKGRDTKPEMIVRRAAHRLGLRFRLQDKNLPGRPDLVFPKWRTVIFVHGCFWHRHDGCRRTTTPKSNVGFWSDKFQANVRRDERNRTELEKLGWRVIVVWECDVKGVEATSALIRNAFPL